MYFEHCGGALIQHTFGGGFPAARGGTFINVVDCGNITVLQSQTEAMTNSFIYNEPKYRGPEVRVYSTGDRFCYDGASIGCQGTTKDKVFDNATVVFMTGQPDDTRGVKGHPTFFGTDVQFGAPVQMPNFPQNQLPAGKPNGSMVYCTNCRRSTTPCQTGGAGAPAMVVGGQWSCL